MSPPKAFRAWCETATRKELQADILHSYYCGSGAEECEAYARMCLAKRFGVRVYHPTREKFLKPLVLRLMARYEARA